MGIECGVDFPDIIPDRKSTCLRSYIYDYIKGMTHPILENPRLEAWGRFLQESDRIENIGIPLEEYRRALTCFTGPDDEFPVYSENHARAFWYVAQNCSRLPSIGDVLELHRRLMQGESDAGRFRQTMVMVGNHIPPNAVSVPYMVEHWCASLHDKSDALKEHLRFEWIHPFRDGNGRTGRLLWAWLSLHKNVSVDSFLAQYGSDFEAARSAYYANCSRTEYHG